MYKLIKKKLLGISISGRILLFFSSLIISSLLITGFFFQIIYFSFMSQQVVESAKQTNTSISSYIKTTLERINSYSRIILSNTEVQALLRSEDGYSEIALRESVEETLSQMKSNFQEITSIYIIDRSKRRYFTEINDVNSYQFNDYFYSSAWSKARLLRGSSYFALDGGAIFINTQSTNFISNIRVINSLYTQKAIGGVAINISEDALKKSFLDISNQYGLKIFLLDENNDLITSSHEYSYEIGEFLYFGDKSDKKYSINKKEEVVYSYHKIDKFNWKIVTVSPLEGDKEFYVFLLTSLISLIVLAGLVFTGSMIITKMITKPVNILADSMVELGKGNLRKVKFDTSIQEFNSLRDGYNKLTDEIEDLISKVVKQEKVKRKAELDTLQAQIKPHFLYNTFDSIASLALMGDNQQVYDMVSSLGNFYRISLSKGKEIITVGEELDALKSYLKILHIRYDNFEIKFDIDKELMGEKIIKLILQPFVENSIYHGIKPKGENGIIEIKLYKDSEYMVIVVKDDGVGMEPDQLKLFHSGDNSFGVKGTLERIKLYYGLNDLVKFKSQKGYGTEVEMRFPLQEG